ncbi:MAG TPA: hypothetical protein VJZ77_19025 [Blastocatellia bacterium]|nr:hypothetical protein [Blastocatellia bacterium]
MFCQSCGFEYTQKTNYCKRCGGNLTSTDKPPVVQLPTLKITGVFFVIAAFVLFSLMFVYSFYWDMIRQQVRGPELFVPFILGIGLIGAVAGLLCWQLSRLITVARKPEHWVEKQERPTFREVQPQGRFVAPADPVRGVVEPPSVVEHTTRQMAQAKLDID